MSTLAGENFTVDSTSTTIFNTHTYPLSEEACLEVGGHCYEENRSCGILLSPLGRTCKHCGKEQRGTPQQDIRWEDA